MEYKKADIKNLNMNPFEEFSDGWALLSAKDGRGVNTMTISWGTLGHLWRKNVATVYIRPQRYTKEFVDGSEYFTITFFNGNFKKELGVLGSQSGRDSDKVSEVNFHCIEMDGQPTFEEGQMMLLCKKIYADELKRDKFIDQSIPKKLYPKEDYHVMYVGEIVGVYQKSN